MHSDGIEVVSDGTTMHPNYLTCVTGERQNEMEKKCDAQTSVCAPKLIIRSQAMCADKNLMNWFLCKAEKEKEKEKTNKQPYEYRVCR